MSSTSSIFTENHMSPFSYLIPPCIYLSAPAPVDDESSVTTDLTSRFTSFSSINSPVISSNTFSKYCNTIGRRLFVIISSLHESINSISLLVIIRHNHLSSNTYLTHDVQFGCGSHISVSLGL